MALIINKIIKYCVHEKLIRIEDVPWFQYSLEKLISTAIVGIPFFILAVVTSDFLCAISFFITYFFIKKYTGGYHAKTLWGCMSLSLLLELLFLGLLSRFLTTLVNIVLLLLCTFAIAKIAPYNHPNLHLTPAEKISCRQKVRKRLYLILLVNAISCWIGIAEISNGCTIGIAMATTLLCMGYIKDWRNTHHGKEYHQENYGKGSCISDV